MLFQLDPHIHNHCMHEQPSPHPEYSNKPFNVYKWKLVLYSSLADSQIMSLLWKTTQRLGYFRHERARQSASYLMLM